MSHDPMGNLYIILSGMRRWSWETRGETADIYKRQEGLIHHIRKELIEIGQEPNDLVEYTDVFLLATDAALRASAWPINKGSVHECEVRLLFGSLAHTADYMEMQDIQLLLQSLEDDAAEVVPAVLMMHWARAMGAAISSYSQFDRAVEEKLAIVCKRQYPPFVEGVPAEHIREVA